MSRSFAVPSVFRRIWRATPLEARRRRQRLTFLIPLAMGEGFLLGVFTAPTLAIPLALWAPVCALGGAGLALVAVQLETLVRARHDTPLGRGAAVIDITTDSLVGGMLMVLLGTVLEWRLVDSFALGGVLAAGLGVSWRRLTDRLGVGISSVRGLEESRHAEYTEELELLDQGRLEEALTSFEAKSEEAEGDPAPLMQAAHVLRDHGQFQRSVDYYARAMVLPGLEARRAAACARNIWEVCDRNLEDPGLAIPHLEELVARHPKARDVEWAWRELTVGMVVGDNGERDGFGAHSTHIPAVRAVESILSGAFVAGASDIHVEDFANGLRVRYRVDGILCDVEPPPDRIRAAVLSRLRVMAGLNPVQSPLPEDARIRVPYAGRRINLRVSTVPTLFGESMALRVLDDAGQIDLDELGLSAEDRVRLAAIVSRPHGMVLATGPGGSGKSTTLRAIVRSIATGAEKISTVEDPVEFAMDGINQTSVNYKSGLTFASLLRSLVRQDPDVLLVGEIRDAETAEIATHAGLTGHLVLSTLHTTDALSALHRLVDMGVPDYLAVHTLEAVVAQRLARRICPDCIEHRTLTSDELEALGAWPDGLTDYRMGAGCDLCRGTGYRGRVGIFELLVLDDAMRDIFLRGTDPRRLEAAAASSGMRTLREDGLAKVRAGITTPFEVARVT